LLTNESGCLCEVRGVSFGQKEILSTTLHHKTAIAESKAKFITLALIFQTFPSKLIVPLGDPRSLQLKIEPSIKFIIFWDFWIEKGNRTLELILTSVLSTRQN
jgi:hypothetical protein